MITPIKVATTPEDLSNLLCASIELEEVKKELKTLKNMCKLTDFTLDELIFMQHAVEEKQRTCIEMQVRTGAVWGEEHENTLFWGERVVLARNCLVQIMTARQIVSDRETVTSN